MADSGKRIVSLALKFLTVLGIAASIVGAIWLIALVLQAAW